MRKLAAITSIVVGIIMAIAGVVTWVVISHVFDVDSSERVIKGCSLVTICARA
jgi:Na+/melibiose symporter-like transporter